MPPQTTVATSTAMATIAPKKKPASYSIFSLKCGCKDAKSVSVSNSHSDGSDKAADPVATSHSGHHHPPTPSLSARPEISPAETNAFTTATTSTSQDGEDEEDDDSPSFSGLLRQLTELERNVNAWDRHRLTPPASWVSTEKTVEKEGGEEKARRRTDVTGFDNQSSQQLRQRNHSHGRHSRSQSEGGGCDGGRVLGKVGESVAVVKQTEDPLGDFRRSMLQMIVEKEILSGEELRELLCSFLALNSPSHHDLIIRAFADIWRDVFSGYGDGAADLLLPPPIRRHRLHQYARNRRY